MPLGVFGWFELALDVEHLLKGQHIYREELLENPLAFAGQHLIEEVAQIPAARGLALVDLLPDRPVFRRHEVGGHFLGEL